MLKLPTMGILQSGRVKADKTRVSPPKVPKVKTEPKSKKLIAIVTLPKVISSIKLATKNIGVAIVPIIKTNNSFNNNKVILKNKAVLKKVIKPVIKLAKHIHYPKQKALKVLDNFSRGKKIMSHIDPVSGKRVYPSSYQKVKVQKKRGRKLKVRFLFST